MSSREEEKRKADNERMSAQGTFLGGFGNLLSGIGGLVGGVVGVLGLIYAKPDLITVVVPVQTLERVVERARAENRPAEQAAEAPVAQPAPTLPVVAPAAPVAPVQSLGGAASAAVTSIADTPNAFVANVRISNSGAAPIMVAGRVVGGMFNSDITLADPLGGSCGWLSPNAASFGSLTRAYGAPPANPAHYRPIEPGQSLAVTLIFTKQFCATAPTAGQPLTLSGTFVIVENDTPRFASVSFENVMPARAN